MAYRRSIKIILTRRQNTRWILRWTVSSSLARRINAGEDMLELHPEALDGEERYSWVDLIKVMFCQAQGG
jgi:hypothetical protein